MNENGDILYNDCVAFLVMGQEVNMISDETDYGLSTVAEIDNQYIYLGQCLPDIKNAILAWQDFNDKEVTQQEMHQILIDNGLLE